MDAARHQIVARAFGRARGENRRLILEEALLDHAAADARNHLRAQHDVRVNFFAAEIEKAIAQALLFGDLLRARHLKRQRFGRRQHLEAVGHDLDAAGRQRRVDVFVGAGEHLARHTDHAFQPDGFGGLERLGIRREHDLRDAVVIAQIDEQQMAVVALPVNPAGQANVLSDVLWAAARRSCACGICCAVTSSLWLVGSPRSLKTRPLALRTRSG